jgi:hypothetical protein
MIRAFKIYKEGKTTDWITILIPANEYSDELRDRKIKFYLELNFQVQLINN